MTYRIVGDVSDLPSSAFGARTLLWWGVLGFVLIEGGAFVLAGGAYLFLMGQTKPWPPSYAPPDLLWGTLFTVLILLSEIPNSWAGIAAKRLKTSQARIALLTLVAAGTGLLIVRGFEFTALNVRWDADAYGSIVWAILFLHTVHLLTDWADSIALAIFSFTHEVDIERLSDYGDNAMYWRFVVIAWLPLYALVYWAPRATL